MDANLLVLKLVFDALGMDMDINSVSKRKEKQKAVYIAQQAAFDLGYRFGWYKMGPYSPKLTRDYYEIENELSFSDENDKRTLKPSIASKLADVKNQVFESEARPDDLDMSQWLELVASFHYLRKVSKYERTEAIKTMEEQKPTLAPYITSAEAVSFLGF